MERIGVIGNCYEYTASGRGLASADKYTFDELLELSITWPDTYHQWVGIGSNTVRWAHNGREISASELPFTSTHGR